MRGKDNAIRMKPGSTAISRNQAASDASTIGNPQSISLPTEVAGRYRYERVGLDSRPVVLLEDGKIGEGAAGMEHTWASEGHTLVIFAHDSFRTMELTRKGDGTWRGNWLAHEKCDVILWPIKKNSIAVVSLYTAEIVDWASPVAARKKQWCERHGYPFILHEQTLDETRPPAWSKIKALRKAMDDYPEVKWLFWSDADAINMNLSAMLEDALPADVPEDVYLLMTSDQNGISSGQFFLRNCEASKRFLADVYEQTEVIQHPWWEQAAMMRLVSDGKVTPLSLPKRWINSYDFEFRQGDAFVHLAGISVRGPFVVNWLNRPFVS